MFAESELRMAEFLAQGEDDATGDVLADLADAETARIAPSEIRTKQGVFRRLVLSAYHSTCCITGLSCPALLVASHIVPWSEDTRNRLNPMNGICLNALHDKAFDKGCISLDPEYRVMVCGGMDHELLARYRGRRITLPRRFLPSQEFLSFHRERIFLGA